MNYDGKRREDEMFRKSLCFHLPSSLFEVAFLPAKLKGLSKGFSALLLELEACSAASMLGSCTTCVDDGRAKNLAKIFIRDSP